MAGTPLRVSVRHDAHPIDEKTAPKQTPFTDIQHQNEDLKTLMFHMLIIHFIIVV